MEGESRNRAETDLATPDPSPGGNRDERAESNGGYEDRSTEERPEKLKGRLRAARQLQRELRDRAGESEELARVWRKKAVGLGARIETLERQAGIYEEELVAARRRTARLQEHSDSLMPRIDGLESDARELRAGIERAKEDTAREREGRVAAERRLEAIDSQLGGLAEQVDRIGSSRSWRFGHAVMRFLRVLTFRRSIADKDGPRKTAERIRELRRRIRSRET